MASPYEKIVPRTVYYGNEYQLEDVPYASPQYYNDLKAELIPENLINKNINQSQYTRGISRIVPMASPTLGGLFRVSEPNTVYLNPNAPDPIKTLGHEGFHLQDENYDKWLREKKASGEIPKDVKTYHDLLKKELLMGDSPTSKTLRDLYQRQYKVGSDFGNSTYETMADLQGIESALPIGKTILDTKIGQEMLPTKEAQMAYLKTSLPGVMKALPYEPDAAEVLRDKIKAAKQYFNELKGSAGKALVDVFR